MDAKTGIFGFFDKDYFVYCIFVLGFYTGVVVFLSAAVVMKYFPPVVLLIGYLFEPLIGQTLSCLLGIDKLPGPLTFIGGILVFVGIISVTYGGSKLKKPSQN